MVQWRWYYHVPSLGIWVLLGLLLVVPRANRNLQAWLILLPLLAVMLLWRMIARLLAMPPSTAEDFGSLSVALAGAWAAVWLLGRWLAGRHGAAAFFLALVVMLTVGGLYYVFGRGSDLGEEVTFWSVAYGIAAITLLLATTLSGYGCRRDFRPRRFMTWLLLGAFVSPIAMILIPVVAAALWILVAPAGAAGPEAVLDMLVMALVAALVVGSILGGTVFIINVPFMILAFHCPFYRGRLQRALRLPDYAPVSPDSI